MCLYVVIASMAALPATASDSIPTQFLPEPQNVAVSFFGSALADAEKTLVGRGIDLGGPSRKPLASIQSPCGEADAEIVWREVRRDTDPEGGMHTFYHQFVAGGGLDAELVGSEVGVHRMPDGKILGISGTQFESVVISGGCPQISAAMAVELATERVLLHKGEYAYAAGRQWTMDARRASRLATTKLELVQVDGAFRPAWFTIGEDAQGEPYTVVLDAVSERLLAITGAHRGANCAPTTPESFVYAYGIPVRPELTNWRSLRANVASRHGGFTHEGVWKPSLPMTSEPLIRHIVYHGTDSGDFVCADDKRYTVFPLKVDPAIDCCSPVYNDIGTTWAGRAAGDALWNAYKTMFAFRAMGRRGWDGVNGDARVVIMAGGGNATKDRAEWYAFNYAGPAESVVINPPQRFYNLAASLDLVAHEFGHGVISKTANFDNTTVTGKQLDEGWADIVGMIVEQRSHNAGTAGIERADWVMHEDSATSGYARGALDDDADGVPGHNWSGPGGSLPFDDRLHVDDGVADPLFPHQTGNMLNVVYRIMSAGGSTDLPSGLNPICARRPGLTGCEVTTPEKNGNEVMNGMGPTKAGSLLFHALQFWVKRWTTWEYMPDRVIEAAFDKYKSCTYYPYSPPYHATAEQDIVRKAFAAIGYPSIAYPTSANNLRCP